MSFLCLQICCKSLHLWAPDAMAQELASLQEQLQNAKAQQEAAGAPERGARTGTRCHGLHMIHHV